MSTVRRRILRNGSLTRTATVTDQRRRRAFEKAQAQLERERVSLARWTKRLKRAFRAVERCQARAARLERKLAQHE